MLKTLLLWANKPCSNWQNPSCYWNTHRPLHLQRTASKEKGSQYILQGISASLASPKSYCISIKGGSITHFLHSYAILLEYERPLAFYCLDYEKRHIKTAVLYWYLQSKTETEQLYILYASKLEAWVGALPRVSLLAAEAGKTLKSTQPHLTITTPQQHWFWCWFTASFVLDKSHLPALLRRK